MPIANADIVLRLTGGASNTVQNSSLGGVKSNTTDVSASLFDVVSSAEAAAGRVEYRCVSLFNNHGTETLYGVKVWLSANTPSPSTDAAIGLGSSGLSGTEQTVANESTAPVGVTFSSPSTQGSGLSVGDLPAGAWINIWIRRTVNPGAASTTDSFTLDFSGDYNP